VAVVELLTPGAYDNLVIPLGTAVLLLLLAYFYDDWNTTINMVTSILMLGR